MNLPNWDVSAGANSHVVRVLFGRLARVIRSVIRVVVNLNIASVSIAIVTDIVCSVTAPETNAGLVTTVVRVLGRTLVCVVGAVVRAVVNLNVATVAIAIVTDIVCSVTAPEPNAGLDTSVVRVFSRTLVCVVRAVVRAVINLNISTVTIAISQDIIRITSVGKASVVRVFGPSLACVARAVTGTLADLHRAAGISITISIDIHSVTA
jgi:hypothetical protein